MTSTTEKRDLRRELRDFYAPSSSPALVEVPEWSFLMVDGRGDPNTSEEYRDAVAALYKLSYTARFALKKAQVLDYSVMPLEGLWWVPDMARFTVEDKSGWEWTAMIHQPDQVTEDVLDRARATVAAKKPSPELEHSLQQVRLSRFTEGTAAQVLHLGPYAAEGPTIAALHAFIADRGYALSGKHHEIYLTDPGRTAPERMRTVIRQPVERATET